MRLRLLAVLLALAFGTSSQYAHAQANDSLDVAVGTGSPIRLLRNDRDPLGDHLVVWLRYRMGS